MLILGLDPSLTGFGWALHDPDAEGAARCPARGRWKTNTSMEIFERFHHLATKVEELVKEHKPDKVGVESTSFGAARSETMYALFTHTNLALKRTRSDVAFFAPKQIKVHPRIIIDRPSDWDMMKADMIEAAQFDAGGGRWSGDSADAYWVAWAAAHFWKLHAGLITPDDLTPDLHHQLCHEHTYKRGKKKGQTIRKGLIHRQGDRFYLWSELPPEGEEEPEDFIKLDDD